MCKYLCPKLLCPLHHSHANTHGQPQRHQLMLWAPSAGEGTSNSKGQLLDQMKCWSLGALVRRESCRVLHIRFKPEAASWTMLLHYISNTWAKIHSQKASSTPPSAYLRRSWVPRGKSTLTGKEFFLIFSSITQRQCFWVWWRLLVLTVPFAITKSHYAEFFPCAPFLAVVYD